jgi:hypothetical protein
MTARDLFASTFPESASATASASAEPVVAGCGTCGNGAPNRNGFIVCSLLPSWKVFPPGHACHIGGWCAQSAGVIARRAAQAGIEQAVSAADREIEGWSDMALRYVRLYATQNRGKQFIGHNIVQASITAGIIQPPNLKAWGWPLQRAAREGIIVRVGYAEDPNRHGNPVPLWSTPE